MAIFGAVFMFAPQFWLVPTIVLATTHQKPTLRSKRVDCLKTAPVDSWIYFQKLFQEADVSLKGQAHIISKTEPALLTGALRELFIRNNVARSKIVKKFW